MQPRIVIVGIGESLFDIYPDRQVLGGAPLNVAVAAHQLASPRDGVGVVVSRIGQGELGERLLAELTERGMPTDHIQTDPDRDTGRVYVDIDVHGQPQFQIVENVAWDVLQFDPDTEDLARRCDAVCFGTLAQRDGQCRNSIYRFLDTARQAVRLLDANLRENSADSRILRRSLELANALKVSKEELEVVCDDLGLRSAGAGEVDETERKCEALIKQFDLRFVALTRGRAGTTLVTPQGRFAGQTPHYPAAEGADPVGAGDACAAAILVGTILRWPGDRIVDLANHAGAYVASQPGATPTLPEDLVKMVAG